MPIRLDAEARDGRQCMVIDCGPEWSSRSERRSKARARRFSYEAAVGGKYQVDDVARLNEVDDAKCRFRIMFVELLRCTSGTSPLSHLLTDRVGSPDARQRSSRLTSDAKDRPA